MNPLERAQLSLEGLSVGDAFGQKFFDQTDKVIANIKNRSLPPSPWYITDDSIMAIAIVEVLEKHGYIDQDALADKFANYYKLNPKRGYGGTAHKILQSLNKGNHWKTVSHSVFDGLGSHGNGAAMRIAPLGAYYAEKIDELISNAKLSAEVTHANIEGQIGALSIALAAAWAWNNRSNDTDGLELLNFVHTNIPDSDTRGKINKAIHLPLSYSIETAVSALGNGSKMSSQDTVPFCLWVTARHIDNYENAIWSTVSALGDRDTTCAIVGGVLALKTGIDGIPAKWRQYREPLDYWEQCFEEWS